ncbi:hypothetical protein [Sphingomonas faeni]
MTVRSGNAGTWVGIGAGIEPIATDSTSAVGCSPALSKTMRLGRYGR